MVATTDANGAFSFTGLGPGRYEVLYVFLSEVRARSGAVGLAVGAMQVNEVTVALSANGGGRRWIGRHPVLAGALIGAGSGFAALYAILATSEYHEDRAWAGPAGLVFGAPIGAVVGAATGFVVSRIKR